MYLQSLFAKFILKLVATSLLSGYFGIGYGPRHYLLLSKIKKMASASHKQSSSESDTDSTIGSPPPLESPTDDEYGVSDSDTDSENATVKGAESSNKESSNKSSAKSHDNNAKPINEASKSQKNPKQTFTFSDGEYIVSSDTDDEGHAEAAPASTIRADNKHHSGAAASSAVGDTLWRYVVSSDTDDESHGAAAASAVAANDKDHSGAAAAASAVAANDKNHSGAAAASAVGDPTSTSEVNTAKSKGKAKSGKQTRNPRKVQKGYAADTPDEDKTPPDFKPHSFPAMPTDLQLNHFEVPPVFANPIPSQVQHYLESNTQTIHAIGRRRRELTLRLRAMKELHDRDNHLINLLMYHPGPEDIGTEYDDRVKQQIKDNEEILTDPIAIQGMYERRSGYSQRRRKIYDQLDQLAAELQMELMHIQAIQQIQSVVQIIPANQTETENPDADQ